MNKILISAKVLQQIIKEQPEVEVELIGSAVAQIAGRMADKVRETLPTATKQIEDAFRAQLAGIKANTRLHPEVKALIKEFIDEKCAEVIKAALEREVTQVALARVDALVKARMTKVEDDLAKAVEKWVTTLEARVEVLAEAKFMALIRGAGKVGAD